MFETGTLWSKILTTTEGARKSGSLQPIFTESIFISDGGIDFLVRIVSSLTRKAAEKKRKQEISRGETKKAANPFLPYEEDMFVADITDTHLCLLNKFNVIDHHLLIVTRSFEDQRTLLTLKDFEAISICMAEFDGLAFYNGGERAGASQPHKHLQMIPLPMADHGPRVPVEVLFSTARFEGALGYIPALPFVHAFTRIETDLFSALPKAAEKIWPLYRKMLQYVGLNLFVESENSLQSSPYNLLFTKEWMMLMPRSEEFFEAISVNALGFAGALLVQNEQQMDNLRTHGGMKVLMHTGIRKKNWPSVDG